MTDDRTPLVADSAVDPAVGAPHAKSTRDHCSSCIELAEQLRETTRQRDEKESARAEAQGRFLTLRQQRDDADSKLASLRARLRALVAQWREETMNHSPYDDCANQVAALLADGAPPQE